MIFGKAPAVEAERLQTALEAAGVGIWDYDPVADELVWSVHCYRLFGITNPKPITLEACFAAIHPGDRDRVRMIVEKAFQPSSGGTYDTEYRTIGVDDGIERWVRATGKVYFGEGDKPFRFVGTIMDISQRKKVEMQVAASEHQFRTMADSAPVMIWITDPNGYCNYLNKRWLDFTGQTLEQGKGLGWTNALHPEDQESTKEAFIQANNSQALFRQEYRLRSRDGQYRRMLDTAHPWLDAQGNFLGYIGAVLDITERKEAEENLQFRKALLEAQNEATENGLLMVDMKGKILSFNRRFVEIWGMPEQFTHQKDDQGALGFAMTRLQDPETFMERVQYLYMHPNELAFDELQLSDGRIIERTGRKVADGEGREYGYLWQFLDVTDRRKEQRDLKLHTAILEAQNESSPLGILVIDEQKQVHYYNKQYVRIFELPENIQARSTREALMDHFRTTILNFDSFLARINQLYSHETAGSVDELRLKNGSIIERYGYPIRSKEGIDFGWSWQFRDITEQRRMEESLQHKNAELEKLIQEFKFVTDFMPQMVWATKADGYHDFFNKQWYDYTGLDYETTKDKGWSLVLHPDDMERTWQVWRHSLTTGEIYQIEYRMRRHDGVFRWFLARAIPMRDEAGKIIKWFGTCTDIDDQRRSAELLEQKVTERTHELREANKNLERSNAELEQFAYVASHDLQEPLRKIRTFTNMLEGEVQREDLSKAQRYIERIWASSTRMQELIRDLLDFSRLNRESSQGYEPTDLNSVVAQVIEDLDLTVAQKEAEIQVDPLPSVEANSLQMSQLFYNLLSNSLKFARAGIRPAIRISCTEASEALLKTHRLNPGTPHYQISVQDNGIGFQDEYAQQIFTIFQRLHNKSAYEGTGIGLALCKKVALNHQGAIYATGVPGEGAVFHVLLPQRQEARQ